MRKFAPLAAAALASLLALAAPALAACEGRDLSRDWSAEISARIAAATDAMPHSEGRLWEVERDGQRSILFGTMHMGDDDLSRLPPALVDGLARAEATYIEVTRAEEKRLMRRMILNPSTILGPPGKRISAALPPDEMALLTEAARAYGMTGERLDRIAPWFLLLTLANPPCLMEQAYSGGEPVLDRLIEAKAEAAGIPVEGLETVDEVFGLFDALSWDRQIAMLRTMLPTLESSEDHLATARAMYLRGEVGAIRALSTGLMADASGDVGVAAAEEVFDLLLRVRNERWIDRLEAPLADGNLVIAVGALHLPGEHGLLRMLENRGYRVGRLDD